MANDFYTRSFNPLPGQRVDEQVLKDEFQLIEQGFDEVESDADTLAARAIKIPESSPDQTLAFSAVQRANLVLAFDASGNITATSFGRWRGDWVTATAYVANDSFRYAPTGSVYTVLVAHTSGVFATDLAANKFSLAIDGTGAAAAAASAAAAATSESNAATSESNAAGSAGTASAAAVSAAASFDAFDDIFLGAKAADPTLDNDGNALQTGALYFNTTVVPKEMRVYDGSAWAAAYLPAAGYATLTGTQTLTNKTISGLLNTITNVTSTRITRVARTSNTMLVAADNGKLIDITSGTFAQTTDTAGNLGANWQVLLANTGTGVPTYSTTSLPQGSLILLHSDGTTVRSYVLQMPEQVLIVRDEKTSGTGGGNATGATWNARDLNTTKVNTIVGASVGGNLIAVPAGTYIFRAWTTGYGGGGSATQHQCRLYNVTASAALTVGGSARAAANAASTTELSDQLTFASATSIRLEHYFPGAVTDGKGLGLGVGVEVYSCVEIRKVG